MKAFKRIAVLVMQYVVFSYAAGLTSSQETSNYTNITLHCEQICVPGQCFYPTMPEMLPEPKYKDCEATLYTQDKVVLDHSLLTLHPVNLTTAYCMDRLTVQINCNVPNYHYQAVYRVRNETSMIRSSGPTALNPINAVHLCLLLILGIS